ncbi:trypsin-like [Microplitis mediator]|uniref:trypsin-like n=1 Tax=Microplitis mediator TaxID=375433 RepID=UPI0025564197|nr:trypsin-like [Microplitis mediator]
MELQLVSILLLAITTAVISTSTSIQSPDQFHNSQQPSTNNSNNIKNLAPYLVSIRLNDVHICSGIIITEWDILTSGQCVYYPYALRGSTYQLVSIHLGSTNRYRNGSIYYAQSIKVYSSFSARHGQVPNYDIATIRLSERIIFDETRDRACVGERNTLKSAMMDKQAVVAEWIDNKIETLNNLQLTNWTIIPDEECNYHYSSMGQVTNGAKICAVNMDRDGDVNMCPGDLGTPLMVDGKLFGYKLWRKGCDSPESPVVFRYIIHNQYLDWIKRNIRGTLC